MMVKDRKRERHASVVACAVISIASMASGHIAWQTPSEREGMGAVPFDGGVTFRVWAPHASNVSLIGDFNNWTLWSTMLAAEPDGGLWSLDVAEADIGDHYEYVIVYDGSLKHRNDPRARAMTNSVGSSIITDREGYQWQVDDFQMADWNESVLYELHVGTFGLLDGQGGTGNIPNSVQYLDYLADLGVTAVELMPIAECAGAITWGYNPAQPFAIEEALGTPDEFKQFVDEAHARGIGVLLDVVFNHLGPSDLVLWQYDGWSEDDRGGIYFFNDDRANTPWGDTRPDYGRQEVRTYIRDNILMWLNEYRVDGFRMDGTKYIRRTDQFGEDIPEGWSLLQWLNWEIDQVDPGLLSIAEDMDTDDWITRPTSTGGAGFDSQWDPLFCNALRSLMTASEDQWRDMWSLRDVLTFSFNADPVQRVIYTESHDEVANGRSRVPEEIWPGHADSWFSKKRSTLGAMVLMTAPGIPMLFQGQEFLEDGFFEDDIPLDWDKVDEFAGIHAMYRDMISLRRNLSGTTRGLTGPSINVSHINDGAKVAAWHRWESGGEGDDVVVVANFSDDAFDTYRIGFPRGGRWRLRFNSDLATYDGGFDDHPTTGVDAEAVGYDGLAYSAEISIGAYSGVIFSQSPPCPADLDGDWRVGVTDLLIVIGGWGTDAGDIDGDGMTNVYDLLEILGAYGKCP